MEIDAFNYADVNENGEELNSVDHGSWDFDVMALFKYKRKYVVFRDSGCSCYSPFEDPKSFSGDAFTKTALKKVLPSWHNGSSVEKEMARWIEENIFDETASKSTSRK